MSSVGAKSTRSWLAHVALAAYAFGLLSIGLTRDWQLRNEDNGALQTTLALSHVKLGLARTHAHDLFVSTKVDAAWPYGHHPPGTALALAGAFKLTGSDTPAVARLVAIVFHLGSLVLFVRLLSRLLTPFQALAGGFVFATLPMSSYFGRMVNYEPLCLFGILLLLYGYVRASALSGSPRASRAGIGCMVAGVIVGGLIDWPAFFFAAALGLVEMIGLVRRTAASGRILIALAATSVLMLGFDWWHLMAAGRDATGNLSDVVSAIHLVPDFSFGKFVLGQIDTFRRYFTDVGLVASALVAGALVAPGSRHGRRIFPGPESGLLRRVLAAAGLAALAYVLAAPSWAMAHQYWQFYFLPFASTAIVLAWLSVVRALRERRTVALVAIQLLFVVDLVGASGYWLYYRHTRIESYAIERTAQLREGYLAPEKR